MTMIRDVQPSAINLPTRADNGEAAMGGVPVEDIDSTLDIVGHRPFYVLEPDCSQPRLWSGWVQERGIGRSIDRGMFVGEDARIHDTTLIEYNAIFGFLQIGTADGIRPAETWGERLAWIVASDYLSPFVSDTGYVASAAALGTFYPNRPMDAADFTGQYPSAVLDDLATRLEGFYFNYFAFWDPDAVEYGLFFNPDSESIGTATLTISNDPADESATCFAPDVVARLNREPDQVYSGVTVIYSHGTKRLYRSRQSTADTYTKRETEIQRPFTGGEETASKQAEAFLDRHSVELDRITCTITVPSASAGLVRAGMHMSVRFTHLGEPYATGTTMRVVAVTPTPTNDTATHYEMALELVALWALPGGSAPEALYAEITYARGPLGSIEFKHTGDSPPPGTPKYETTGAVEILGAEPNLTGIRMLGSGTVTVTHGGYFQCVATPGAWIDVTLVGTTVPAQRYYYTGAKLGYWGQYVDISDTLYVSSGTEFSVVVTRRDFGMAFCYYRALPAMSRVHSYLSVSGSATSADPDTETALGPTPFATVTDDRDPTVDDDTSLGYSVGNRWINTTTGEEFVLVDATDGAAVWVSTTSADGGTTPDADVRIWRPILDETGHIITDDVGGEAIMGYSKR